MESTVSIDQLQEELTTWKHELSSIKKEIAHFERQLEDFSSKPLPKDLLAQVEHFQNSFICQREVLDHLRHDLPDSRQKVEHVYRSFSSVLESPSPSDRRRELSDRMDTFRRIYQEIKTDFFRFQRQWL